MRTNSKQFQYVSDLCTGNYTWAYKSSVVWRAAMTLANLNLWPLCHELCALSISASSRHSLLIILIYAIIYRSAYITNPNCISASLVVGALLAIALDLNFVFHVANCHLFRIRFVLHLLLLLYRPLEDYKLVDI